MGSIVDVVADQARCEMCGAIKSTVNDARDMSSDSATQDAIRALAERWAYAPDDVAMIFLRILFPSSSYAGLAKRWGIQPTQAQRIRKRLELCGGMKSFLGETLARRAQRERRRRATTAPKA